MADAGTSRRHANRVAPGACVHPTAEARLSNNEKDGVGGVDTCARDSIIAARKGAELGECLEIAVDTDREPADWP